MPRITNRSGPVVVRLPILRSVMVGDKLTLQVVGSLLAPVADAQGLYIGPNGYTSDPAQAQSFATVSSEQITVESPGAPGKSAYQVWLDAGNQGDRAAYLASLKGDPGMNATAEQVSSAVATAYASDPPAAGKDGRTPTADEVQALVAAIYAANPPAPGKNGLDATTTQIATAVAAWLTAHPPPSGANATADQIANAVATWMQAHPIADGKSIELQAAGGYIQARQTGGAWGNIIALSALVGPPGPSPLVVLGEYTLTQTAGIAITAGIRTVTVSGVTGLVPGDNVLVFPKADLPAGYAIHNAWCTVAGTMKVTLTAPLLAVGASYAIIGRVAVLR